MIKNNAKALHAGKVKNPFPSFLTLEAVLGMIESAQIPMTIADTQLADTPLIYANQAFYQLTGYSEQDILGKNCRFLQGDYHQPHARKIIRDAIKTQQSCHVDLVNFDKNGQQFINRLHLCPLEVNGEYRYVAGFQKHIHNHQENFLLQALTTSNHHYKSLIDAMSEGVILHDASGKILEANLGAQRILGLSLDQMQGLTSMDPRWEAIHEDGSPYPGEDHPVMKVLESGEPVFNAIMGVRKPTQELRWISINATPIAPHYESDSSASAIVIINDITDQKYSEWLALHDELSGLFNRRHLNQVMPTLIKKVPSPNLSRYFMMIDCDNFKAFNDLYGHAAGDEVIELLGSKLLQEFSRNMDLSFRIGGEEFAVFFISANLELACKKADKFRRVVEQAAIEHLKNPPWNVVTVSIGLYELPFDSTLSLDGVYEKTDAALYEAKALGRNRFVIAQA